MYVRPNDELPSRLPPTFFYVVMSSVVEAEAELVVSAYRSLLRGGGFIACHTLLSVAVLSVRPLSRHLVYAAAEDNPGLTFPVRSATRH